VSGRSSTRAHVGCTPVEEMAGPHGTRPDPEAGRSARSGPALARVSAMSSAWQAECRGLEHRLTLSRVPCKRGGRVASSPAREVDDVGLYVDRSNSRRDSPQLRGYCPRGPRQGRGRFGREFGCSGTCSRPVHGRRSCSGTRCPYGGNCPYARATPDYAVRAHLRAGRSGNCRDGTPLAIRRGCRPASFPGHLGRCRRPDTSGCARCAAYGVDRRDSAIDSASASAPPRTTCPAE